jgi:hypothetical protein
MTAAIPSSVPTELIAGDTWQWTRDLADYPAGTWTATVYFENKDGVFNVTASASGTTHSFTIAAATTTGYKPGRYGWRLRVTDGTTTTTVENGLTEVQIDPAKAGKADTRTWARRVLDAIEATLEGRASSDQLAMSINGRSISRTPFSELMDARDRFRNEVRAQESPAGSGKGRDIKVRFT